MMDDHYDNDDDDDDDDDNNNNDDDHCDADSDDKMYTNLWYINVEY